MIDLRCTNCLAILHVNFSGLEEQVCCPYCKQTYLKKNNFIDLIQSKDIGTIEMQALDTWGNDLHKEGKKPLLSHVETMHERMPEMLTKMEGIILDLGCGCGYDTNYISRLPNTKLVIGMDIGKNCEEIAQRVKNEANIMIVRGNCLNLPFKDNQFNYIYSYGVIHHTNNPLKALNESKRVLKKGGALYFYVYTTHSKNFFKRVGITLEAIIMRAISPFNKQSKNIVCILLALFSWSIFSLPAIFLRQIGQKSLARKIPMNFGKTPLSILPDIKDRLLAPVNHRYSTRSLKELIRKAGLIENCIVEDYTGIYCCAEKIS